jgi:poly(3-hydroxyoctanoate) depolymerase
MSKTPSEHTQNSEDELLAEYRFDYQRAKPKPCKLLFLPGASGNTQFWVPVADLLSYPAEKTHLGWPGFGSTPSDPSVHGINDLVDKVVAQIDCPTALIAQSMGGVIAIRAALERPDLITHLVLTVTSGGVDISDLGAQDWRPSFHESHPSLPRWLSDYNENLAAKLQAVTAPTLLLWGDADPISPASVGQRLASLLPNAKLHVLLGGNHDLASVFAHKVAPLINEHLSKHSFNF